MNMQSAQNHILRAGESGQATGVSYVLAIVLTLISLIMMACTISLEAGTTNQATFLYVSQNGSDNNPGTKERPFATLEKARDAVRLIGGPKVVSLAVGTYRLARTFALDERDGDVTYQAQPSEEVRITGGFAIPNAAVKPVTDAAVLERLLPEVRGKVLEVDLRALGITDFGAIGPRGFSRPYVPAPLELVVDDEPLSLAQWPKPGQPGEPMGNIIDKGPVSRNGDKPNRGGCFEFKTDRPARWTHAQNVWITGIFSVGWADNTVQVKAFDLTNKTLTTVQPDMYGFSSGKPWNRWTALNLLEEISLPGEFMADFASGKLYFLPPAGKDIAKCRLEVTMLNQPLVAIEGATGVVFDGIIFENTRGMGVYIERGASDRIQNCTLRNIGEVAVCVGKGVTPDKDYQNEYADGQPVSRELGSLAQYIYSNTTFNRDAGTGHGIVNCRIYNIGAGGISLGGGDRLKLLPAGNFVENCEIHHFNRWDRAYRPGVWIDGVGNIVRHCSIHDCPSNAILLHGNEHLIEYNEIYHAVMLADDQGALYMGRNPSERGNIIRYNYWHDLSPARGNVAIYFDDSGGDSTLVYGNVFRNAGGLGGIFLNGCSDVRVINNIFINRRPLNIRPRRYIKEEICEARLKAVAYDQSPWREKYPDFVNYLKERSKMPRGNVFEKNLVVNYELATNNTCVHYEHNLLVPKEPDLKHVNIPGFEPIPFEKIGSQSK